METTLLSKQGPPSPFVPQSVWEEPPRQSARLGSTLLLPVRRQAGRGPTSAGQDLVWCWLGEDEAGHGQLAA